VLGGILPEKLSGWEAEVVFKTQNVIGGQKLVQVSAALIKTGNIGRTLETKWIFK
jgi:hypothetical protein